MTVTVATFRNHYPEFADTTKFSNPLIDYWITVATSMLNASRWGAQLDLATELYVAHNVVLEAKAILESGAGGLPGQATGPVNSKSVDKVSVGYDVAIASEQGAGHWNLTIYGTRLWRLIKMFGVGPIQIGVGYYTGVLGWSGPDVTPGPTNFG